MSPPQKLGGLMKRNVFILLLVALPLAALSAFVYAQSTKEKIAPWVVDTSPERGEELSINTNSGLKLFFDRPMDRASVETSFKVTPAVKGTLTWSSDTAVTFQPSETLKRASEYVFTVDGNKAKSQEGV